MAQHPKLQGHSESSAKGQTYCYKHTKKEERALINNHTFQLQEQEKEE